MAKMKRGLCSALTILALITPVFLAGCLIPYAYPKLSHVPGYEVANPNITDIHAFRVDVTAHQADIDERDEYTLTPVTPRSDGSYPAQTKLSLERGYYVLGVVVNFNVAQLHTVRLRLYRPGFHLAELTSWDSADKVQWQPAKDWVAQEKATDDLLRQPAVTASEATRRRGASAILGQSSPPSSNGLNISKPVIEFVASEYERVAAIAPSPQEAARLRGKAKQLRSPEVIPVIPASSITGVPATRSTPESP
jgi:hypothetical protein